MPLLTLQKFIVAAPAPKKASPTVILAPAKAAPAPVAAAAAAAAASSSDTGAAAAGAAAGVAAAAASAASATTGGATAGEQTKLALSTTLPDSMGSHDLHCILELCQAVHLRMLEAHSHLLKRLQKVVPAMRRVELLKFSSCGNLCSQRWDCCVQASETATSMAAHGMGASMSVTALRHT